MHEVEKILLDNTLIKYAYKKYLNKDLNNGCSSCIHDAKVELRLWLRENLTYSLIIPTMWRSDKIYQMLPKWNALKQIKEIIIIDNDPKARDNSYEMPSKVGYLTTGKNIYVNPAWNWGVKESSAERIILANDDILLEPTHVFMRYITKALETYDLVGVNELCYKQDMPITIVPQKSLTYGFGTLMFMNKRAYKPIDERIKIWRGDNLLIRSNKSASFTGVRIETKMSETINSSKEFKSICQNDLKVAGNYLMAFLSMFAYFYKNVMY